MVSFEGCRESSCTDLRLYEDGTFDLEWSWPRSANSSESEYFDGKYLVLEEKIILYLDSSFNANGQQDKLRKFSENEVVPIESRGFSWHGYGFKPKFNQE